MLSFISSSAALALILALQAQGHAIITPALGGGSSRDDVQRPSASSPCGAHVDIVGKVGFSQVVQVKNGQIPVTATNFNTGVDGSRQIVTALIDPTGTGNNFQAASVSTNGDNNPTNVGSQPIVVNVPDALKARTGRMLISLTTAGGFGNCVVIESDGGASAAATTGGKKAGGRGGRRNRVRSAKFAMADAN